MSLVGSSVGSPSPASPNMSPGAMALQQAPGVVQRARWMVSPREPWRRAWDGLGLFFTSVSIVLLPLAYLKLGDPRKALENCEKVLKYDPESVKGLFRRAQARM